MLPNEYQDIYGRSLDTEGVVVERPSLTQGGNQAIIILPDGFTQYVRASLFHHAYVGVGDRVWVRGTLREPENFSGFDYVSYLKQKGVRAELTKAKIIVVGESDAWPREGLEELRQMIIRRTELLLSKDAAAIVLGMLIGQRDSLAPVIEDSFRKTGLIHILVVSGFNLTLIASGAGIFARVIGRKLSDYVGLGMVWLFVVLVGGSSAVIRAGVMASILIFARLCGRLVFSSVSLLFAVAIMCMINPWQLFYDIGFQLSILATWGVLQANALRLDFGGDGWLGEIVWPSCGAIAATAPLIAYYFGTFSLIAPLANLLVLPTIPLLMLFGALSVFPYLHGLFSPILEALISLELLAVKWLAGWKYSQIDWAIHPAVMIGYYIFLISILQVFLVYKRRRLKKNDANDTMTKIII